MLAVTNPRTGYQIAPARRSPEFLNYFSFRRVKLTGATPPSSVSPAAPKQLPAGARRTFEPFLVVLLVLGQAVFVQVVDQIRQQPLPPRSLLVGEQLPRRLHDGISPVVEGGQEPLDVAGTCGGGGTGSGAAAGPGRCPTPPPAVTPRPPPDSQPRQVSPGPSSTSSVCGGKARK